MAPIVSEWGAETQSSGPRCWKYFDMLQYNERIAAVALYCLSVDDDVDDGFVAFYPEGSRGVMEGQFPACHAPTSCGAKCAKAVDDALTSCVKWVDADQPSGTPRDACGSTLDHAEKTCSDESPGQVHSCYETAAAGFRGLLTGSER